MTATGIRNAWLRLDDDALLKQCRQERYRSSGPGGQRRNKVQTAIKLHHDVSGASVHADESRLLRENRLRALRRLRERIAMEVRAPFDLAAPTLPPELIAQRKDGTLSINPKNPAYPIVVATALDALVAAGASYAKAARALGITTSQFLRLLHGSPALQRATEELRHEARAPAPGDEPA